MRIRLLAMIGFLFAHAELTIARDLTDCPVWAAMDGMWRGELDYLDGDGEFITKDYNAIFDIRIDGAAYHQTNWMYYPPGSRSAAWLSRGLAGPGEGVEFIVNTFGRADGDAGDMVVTRIDHGFDFEGQERARVISDTVVLYDYYAADTGILQHLQMVNMGAKGQRIRSAQGFDPHRWLRDPVSGEDRIDPATGQKQPNPRFGKVRGLSLYRETRMDRADFAAVRAEFRSRHNVKVLVFAGDTPDAPSRIQRLDA